MKDPNAAQKRAANVKRQGIKLTKPQLALLQECAATNAKTCHDDYKPGNALRKLGFIVMYKFSFTHQRLEITDAGREYLKAKGTA
jgi:hypothetical protein